MNYPLISEYVEAIKLAEDNLDQLSYLRPILDDQGNPIMSSGNFAVVFKMKDARDGKLYAMKCFIKDQEGRDEAYKLIAEELGSVSAPFIVPVMYFERELFVNTSNSDETCFPVLLMYWVEGVALDKYVRAHLHDQYSRQLISYQFCRMAVWLMTQPFAHGDITPDNILVKQDGSLVLLDYDGMFVPAMKGQKAREVGSPGFRHPSRNIDDFNEHIDDFPLATISMQLYAISLKPDLLATSQCDTLLLTEDDYQDLGNNEMMNKLFSLVNNSIEFEKLISIFLMAHSKSSLSTPSFLSFNIKKPHKPESIELPSTMITIMDRVNGIKDRIGALYSKDGKRLLNVPEVSFYQIKSGTIAICEGAFSRWDNNLWEVSIPNSIITINDQAFWDCTKLSYIVVESGNQCYDSRDNCNAIIETSTNKLIVGSRNTVIPDSVTAIGKMAFCGRNIYNITIPKFVTTIGDQAFWNCGQLKSIIIPSSVTKIGKWAFCYCRLLAKVKVSVCNQYYDSRENCNAIIETATNKLIVGCMNTVIPNSVTMIGNSAFEGCKELKSITIPDSVEEIGEDAFCDCCSLTKITIPCTVKIIGVAAFSGCKELMWISIPESVVSIADRLLENCDRLKSITIPNSVTTIGKQAFRNCIVLTSITIPNSVTTIDDLAFYGCYKMTSITIPRSVIKIGKNPFGGCMGLINIVVERGNHFFDSRDNCNAIIETSTNKLIVGCMNTVIPNSVTTIGNNAFEDCKELTSITIPNSVKEIGEEAFDGCCSLTEITIPNSVNTIGNRAFHDCVKLCDIAIPNSVTIIDDQAFEGCKELKSITIPNSVTIIGKKMFFYCTELAQIIIPDSVKSIGDSAFAGCKGLTSINIPNSVTTIGNNAFDGCSNLINVTLPNTVTIIGDSAFAGCKGLSNINIPNSVTTIGNNTFDGCSNLTNVTLPNTVTIIGDSAFAGCKGLTSINIPNSVTTIGNNAFSGCSKLDNIIIPNTVATIGEGAFEDCEELTNITIPSSVLRIGDKLVKGCVKLTRIVVESGNQYYDSRNRCNAIIKTSTNTLIIGCRETVIPDSITTIGDSAFESCRWLTGIIIPNSVEKIGDRAFCDCYSLTRITVPCSVNSIGKQAFCSCGELESITIPDAVTTINDNTFDSCYELKNIIIPNTVTSIGESAFAGCWELTSITIPNSVKTIGKWAFDDCTLLKTITLSNSIISIGSEAINDTLNLEKIIVPKGSREKFEKLLDLRLSLKIIEI